MEVNIEGMNTPENMSPFFSKGSNFCTYSRTSMAQTTLGPWKFVPDMGSSSHCGLIVTLGREANDDNLENSFRSSRQ